MSDLEMELTGGSEEVVEETPVEETPTPEETPAEEVAPEATLEETPETPEEPMLYETPDGRQITAEQLQTEWKDNFLPEFTRKSQALAEIEREKNINKPQQEEPEWAKDDYVPQNYAEVIKIAKAEALAEIQNSAKAEQERAASIRTAVENQLAGIKAADPKLDENALFQHANKYGFSDLKTAHANMVDMRKTAVDTEKRTVKNLKDREADPISTGQSGEIPEVSGYDPGEMSQFDGAGEFLATLKGKK